jgi:hypothetical protein
MSVRAVFRLLGIYAVIVIAACISVRACVGLRIDDANASSRSDANAKRGEVIATVWQHGQPIARAVLPALTEGATDPALDAALAKPGATLVYEIVLAEGPILTRPAAAFAMSLVPGRDGVKATLGSKTAYVTPDEILARQGYDKGINVPELGLALGADVELIVALLAERLDTTVPKLRDEARIRRVRVHRIVPLRKGDMIPRVVTASDLTANDVRNSIYEAALFLARGVADDGHFRYMIDAPTNRTLGGYDWPRHAGATYFLAQAAALTRDGSIAAACLRAANLMRTGALGQCQSTKCIGDGDIADVGSTALGLIAFVEIVRTGLDPTAAPLVADLARFLRFQQRADGEFMHEFNRPLGKAIDVQYLYFSGEATLALSRAYTVTKDPADLEAASKGLAHLVGPAWRFFGDRYYFGEEHWTCQAVDDLWASRPNADALDFCLRWHAYGRNMQYAQGETPYDAEGAFGVGPVITPRLTPVASRCEAGVATLAAARKAGVSKREDEALELQLRKSLALLIRHQLTPGLSHLFADPAAVRGAMPGSPVDWQLRIDYAQHAGSAMVRWLELSSQPSAMKMKMPH